MDGERKKLHSARNEYSSMMNIGKDTDEFTPSSLATVKISTAVSPVFPYTRDINYRTLHEKILSM